MTDLAGLPPPFSLVPPLSGISQAPLVKTRSKGLLAKPPRSAALTQFSRCPITASEFLTDISGKGPAVITRATGRLDYRALPADGSTNENWECAYKGWEWAEHHDLTLMGYSIRVDGWRYTAWLPWDGNRTAGVWTYPPFGEELYSHSRDPFEPPGMFDELETVNLLRVNPLEPGRLESVSAEHRSVGRKLFYQLRAMVIERRGVADEEFYRCDRHPKKFDRMQCQKSVAAKLGFDLSFAAQVASRVDSRPRQASRTLGADLARPVRFLPLTGSADKPVPTEVRAATSPGPAVRGSAPNLDPLPRAVSSMLSRLRLLPDRQLGLFNEAIAAYETVARAGDEVLVGDVELLIAQLARHTSGGGGDQGLLSGIRYKVVKVLPPVLVPEELRGSSGTGPAPVDLELELVAIGGPVTAGDTQAMGLGYVPRDPTEDASEAFASPEARRALPLVTDLDAEPRLFEPGVSEEVVPKLLYAPSHTPAILADAGWADRTDQIQWLPADLAEFDRRLHLLSRSLADDKD